MEHNYEVFVTCDACGEKQLTKINTCRRCSQKFSFDIYEYDQTKNKPQYLSPININAIPESSEPKKENKIAKEISCYQCRSLWIGIVIAGLVFTAIMNFTFNLFDFELYQTYDLIRYVSALCLICVMTWSSYKLLKYYCKGGWITSEDKIEKGSKLALTFGLGLAVASLFLIVLTAVSLETSLYFYENYHGHTDKFNQFSSSEKRDLMQKQFLKESNQCRFVKSLIDRSGGDLRIEYHDITIGFLGSTFDEQTDSNTPIGEKYKECWK